MKFRTQKITALMAAAVLGISAFGSVPVTAAESTETADIRRGNDGGWRGSFIRSGSRYI